MNKKQINILIGIMSVFGSFMLFTSIGLQSVCQKFEYKINMPANLLANYIKLNKSVSFINTSSYDYSKNSSPVFDVQIYLEAIDVNAFCTIKNAGKYCVLMLNGVKSTNTRYTDFLSGKDLPPLKAIKINTIFKNDFLKQLPYKPKTTTNIFNFIFSYFAYYIMEYVVASTFIIYISMRRKRHVLLHYSFMILLLSMLFPFYSENIYSFKQSVALTSWMIFGIYYLLMGTTSGILWLLYIVSVLIFYFYNKHNSNQILLNACIFLNITVILYGLIFLIFPGYHIDFPYSNRYAVITNIRMGYFLWLTSICLKLWYLLKQKRIHNAL